jgi:serine/threonine protein phosphatase PrpC
LKRNSGELRVNGKILLGNSVAGVTCQGRRSQNEDSMVIEPVSNGYLFAVADGVGGHNAGEVASGIAIQELTRYVVSQLAKVPAVDPGFLLRDGFSRAHEEIILRAKGEQVGMSTTLVAALVLGQDLFIANTGDSRAYLIRDRIIFRTKDHSVVQSLVDKELIPENERHSHPFRCYLTRCLGGIFETDHYHLTLEKNDLILLSSDGFHEYVPESEINAGGKEHPLEEIIGRLVNRALEGSDDNITIILYRNIAGDDKLENKPIRSFPFSCDQGVLVLSNLQKLVKHK